MHKLYRLNIEIDEPRPPEGAVALLVPMPPTTPHQALVNIKLPSSWRGSQVKDGTGVQRAMWVELPTLGHAGPIVFEMSDCGELNPDHMTRFEDAIHLTADVFELADKMGVRECTSDGERLRSIIDVLAAKFEYRSGFTNNSPLSCDILAGNCLSINEAFLKLAKVSSIPAAYYIGYFFEGRESLKSRDWHCWVSTLTSQGFESWDIAHHLKRGLGPVQPALNPCPGTRFATCVGRQLSFQLPVGQIVVPHLCEPRWILGDGSSQPCEILISLDVPGASLGSTADMPAIDRPHASRDVSECAV